MELVACGGSVYLYICAISLTSSVGWDIHVIKKKKMELMALEEK